MAENVDLLATSSDYQAMQPYWEKVNTILQGTDAMRAAGKKYLPQFPNEDDKNYEYRRKNAKFTNIYRDIVENLAAKPFGKEVKLAVENLPPSLEKLQEDVDGAANHLHAFAMNVFFAGLNNAIDWIFVDHTRLPAGATLADERAIGARPFLVRVPATDMLAVYSAIIKGTEQFIYARMNETYVTQAENGVDEETVCRVRVLIRDPIYPVDGKGNLISDEPIDYGPPRFEIWEQTSDSANSWTMVDSGEISLDEIPLVPVLFGRREGLSWRVLPPMKDIADLQIEHFQAETDLKMAKQLTAFPMLAGNGVTPTMGKDGKPVPVPVGPSAVLYAPMGADGKHGQWQFIEPNANSLKFLSEEVDKIEKAMRELGRIPLMAGTAGITQIAAALQSQKVSSAVQAWAWVLKDALEKAFVFVAKWLNEPTEPAVFVNTDIAVDLGSEKTPEILRGMRQDGDISQRTYWEQMQERGVLTAEFDPDEEERRILDELPGEDGEEDIRAAVTPPAPDEEVTE